MTKKKIDIPIHLVKISKYVKYNNTWSQEVGFLAIFQIFLRELRRVLDIQDYQGHI